MRAIFITAMMVFPLPVHAAGCEYIIDKSKTVEARTISSNELNVAVDRFCKEYKASSNNIRAFEASGSYKLFSANVGASSSSSAELYQKYCSQKESGTSSEQYYKEYIESIAKGAFDAYSQCINMNTNGVHFTFSDNAITKNNIDIVISFNRKTAKEKATFKTSFSDGIWCAFGGDAGQEFTLLDTGSVILKCTRQDSSNDGSVTIARTNSSNESLTLRWTRFSDDGYPIDGIKSLDRKLNETVNALKSEVAVNVQNVEALTNSVRGGSNEEMFVTAQTFPQSIALDPNQVIASTGIQFSDWGRKPTAIIVNADNYRDSYYQDASIMLSVGNITNSSATITAYRTRPYWHDKIQGNRPLKVNVTVIYAEKKLQKK